LSFATLLTCRAHDGERLAREETVEDSNYHPRNQGLHGSHVVLDVFKGRVLGEIVWLSLGMRKRK
jgi:hypothetical protein